MGKIVPRGAYSFCWIYEYVNSIINSKVFENIFWEVMDALCLTVSLFSSMTFCKPCCGTEQISRRGVGVE
jgi:hypothetical protein